MSSCFLPISLCLVDVSKSPPPPPARSSAAASREGASALPHRSGGGPGSWWVHLLATAESWSRMRPSPSNIVSSVSLLSSTVTAETEGLSPQRLGSSWIFI